MCQDETMTSLKIKRLNLERCIYIYIYLQANDTVIVRLWFVNSKMGMEPGKTSLFVLIIGPPSKRKQDVISTHSPKLLPVANYSENISRQMKL